VFSLMRPIAFLDLRSLKHLAGHLDVLIRAKLWVKVLLGMVLGIIVGIVMGPTVGWVEQQTAATLGNWLALPGMLFLSVVQMVVIPLIFSSIIRGLAAGEDAETLKSMGIKAVSYFLVTTIAAIVLGISLATAIVPGRHVDPEAIRVVGGEFVPRAPVSEGELPGIDEIPSTIVRLLPANPLGAMVEMQMLQIVIFSVFIGIALLSMAPDKAKPLLDLLGSLQEVCMTVVRWAMLIAPLAVFGLMARLTSTLGIDVLLGMAVYVGTVLLGLALLLAFYLVLVAVLGRHSPWEFLKRSREVMLLAFSTSSSAAVMPLSIKTAEQELGVRPSVSQFIIPLGATVNMNGTALYQGVATVFLAQVFGIELSTAALAFVVVTAVSASIGAPATPGVGIVILASLLQGVGIPAGGVALIIGVDRILDMSRTAINVMGDLAACAVLDRWVGGRLSREEQLEREAALDMVRERSGEDVISGKD
jgi:Na+/H+-dicarboxylate symporter